MALSSRFAVVLVRVPGHRFIERYSYEGRSLASTRVPAATLPQLSATEERIVFSVGKDVRVLDVRSGAVTRLATAGAIPIGLSIEGRRVAWAENVTIGGKLRGRIRALFLP